MAVEKESIQRLSKGCLHCDYATFLSGTAVLVRLCLKIG